MQIYLLLIMFFLSSDGFADSEKVEKFLFIGSSNPAELGADFREDIQGVQVVYSWKVLEPKQDSYQFDLIERDLIFLSSKRKKLWVQLQDRFFNAEDRLVPDYLLSGSAYQGGLARQKDNPGEGQGVGAGWVTKQWNPHVRARYQKLIAALAKNFDGRIYGINLPETSADIDIKHESKLGFSCDEYFFGTTENINFARSVFAKSYVVQYVNFWPCEWNNDHKYMARFFQNALEKGIGLGGPDIIPYRQGQMKNSYPFFNQFKDRLPIVAFAVQEPTRTYTNPRTGKKHTDEEFLDFGSNYLGAKVIFWSLKE